MAFGWLRDALDFIPAYSVIPGVPHGKFRGAGLPIAGTAIGAALGGPMGAGIGGSLGLMGMRAMSPSPSANANMPTPSSVQSKMPNWVPPDWMPSPDLPPMPPPDPKYLNPNFGLRGFNPPVTPQVLPPRALGFGGMPGPITKPIGQPDPFALPGQIGGPMFPFGVG